MSETPSPRSSLSRLVLFMVCLSVAGSIVAGVHYYAVDRPELEALALQAPQNGQELLAACNICKAGCMGDRDEWGCLQTCGLGCPDE